MFYRGVVMVSLILAILPSVAHAKNFFTKTVDKIKEIVHDPGTVATVIVAPVLTPVLLAKEELPPPVADPVNKAVEVTTKVVAAVETGIEDAEQFGSNVMSELNEHADRRANDLCDSVGKEHGKNCGGTVGGSGTADLGGSDPTTADAEQADDSGNLSSTDGTEATSDESNTRQPADQGNACLDCTIGLSGAALTGVVAAGPEVPALVAVGAGALQLASEYCTVPPPIDVCMGSPSGCAVEIINSAVGKIMEAEKTPPTIDSCIDCVKQVQEVAACQMVDLAISGDLPCSTLLK